jgi:branched-chain amino acid transport system permease protein
MKKNSRIVMIVLLGVLLVMALILPIVDKNSYQQLLFNTVLINIVVVMGMNFITGLTGQMNLGTAGIFALGAYTSSLVCMRANLPAGVGLLAAILMGLIIGQCLGYPSLRVSGVYLALTTIGFGEIVRLVLTNWGNFTGGALGLTGIPHVQLFGIAFDTVFKSYYLNLAFTVLLGILAARIVYSKWGRAFKAIRDNFEAVSACGIDVSRLKILAFTLAAMYGSFAGALYANLVGYLNPSAFGLDFSINYLVMLMLGGIGSVAGNIIGAITVTLLPEFLRFMQNYYWLIFSIITLLFVVFLPYGIVSLFTGRSREGPSRVLAKFRIPKQEKEGKKER